MKIINAMYLPVSEYNFYYEIRKVLSRCKKKEDLQNIPEPFKLYLNKYTVEQNRMSNQDRTTQRQWAHKKGIRTNPPPNPPPQKKTGGELMYSRQVSSSCFFQLTRRIGHHCRQTDSNNINKT